MNAGGEANLRSNAQCKEGGLASSRLKLQLTDMVEHHFASRNAARYYEDQSIATRHKTQRFTKTKG
jgi:hypothetical protein